MTNGLYILSSLCLPFVVRGLAIVQLGDTTVSGLALPELNQEFFGGIPFAEPAIGNLRFSPPVLKLTPGASSFDASHFGVSCTQFQGSGLPPVTFNSTAISEDCLTLNVFRPAGLNESSLVPVMVWVYGGGFYQGSASTFNASTIIRQSVQRGTPIIYVNLNYRVGPLGFPQGKEAESEGLTNLGHKDVLAALTWVRSNIAAFGGDKDKVTIFGQSAGSVIIHQLLLNPTFDLARAAIMESASAGTPPLEKASDNEDAWQFFVSGVPECSGAQNESTFDCLRSASLETIFDAANSAIQEAQKIALFSPVIDGAGGIVPDYPSRLLARGEFARIPFIAGTNLDEGTRFTPTSINSSVELQQSLLAALSPAPVPIAEQTDVINTIIDLYANISADGSPFGTGNETFGLSPEFKRAAAVVGDLSATSLRRQFSQAASGQAVEVFSYLFTDPQTQTYPPYLGVPHAAEVPYIYGAPQNGPESEILSRNMIDYWLSFATSLQPNDGLGNSSRPMWTQYTSESENVLNLNGANTSMIPDTFRAEQITFMNDHAEALLH